MKPRFEIPQRSHYARKPDSLTGRAYPADQETSSPNTAPKLSPIEDPLPQNTEGPDLITGQVSVVDQNTALLPVIVLNSSSVEASPPPDSSTHRAFIAEQETSLLGAIPNLLPAKSPLPPELSINQLSVADQETMSLEAIPSSPPAVSATSANNLPGFLRYMFSTGLARLQEPQPEGLLTRGLQAIRPGTRLGLVPLLALTNASSLLIVSLSYYLSVWGYSYPTVEACFLGGLLLMFAPNLVRLLSRAPSRLERICLLCVLGLIFYLVQFMSSPLAFSSFDDFLHWRTADDILRTGHLFSVNSMLPVSPYYPGLELVTDAISTTTRLSIFQAGVSVTIAAHFLMVLALFLLFEQITGSSRMAGIGVLVYMANPHFIFFDSIYSYETLALPLAILMIYTLTRYANTDKNQRWLIAIAWIVLAAVTITHHMTDYIFDGILLLWAGVSFFRPAPSKVRIHLAAIATFALFLSLAYAFLLSGNPVWSYLSDYFGSAFGQLEQIIAGVGSPRPLFTSAVQAPPVWDKLFITGAIALVAFSLPFGLLTLQRLHRDNSLAVTFGIASLSYPLTQAFRFTSFGTEITDRAAAFLFLPIAYMLAVLITHFWPTRRLSRRTISLITGAILVIFLGNVIVETGPNLTGIPGPYLVVADARSVEPEGIEAALWGLTYLGPDNRIATDRINQMLMSTYGHQRIVTRLDDNIDVAPLFYAAQFDSADTTILQNGQIRYLVVDTRISAALPLEGTYFENDVPHSIISRDALTKFNAVTQMNRLFDSGDIVIYDAGSFINGSGS